MKHEINQLSVADGPDRTLAAKLMEAKVGELFRHFKGNFYIMRGIDADADRNDKAYRVVYQRAYVSEIDTHARTENKRPFVEGDLQDPNAWARMCVHGERFSRSLESFVSDVPPSTNCPGATCRFAHILRIKHPTSMHKVIDETFDP